MAHTQRARLVLLAAAGFHLLGGEAGVGAQSLEETERPVAIVAELDGIIHPVSAEYITGVINEADTTGAEIMVLVLQTPGGLLDSTREIVSRMITARTPVVVFVGPSGASAASAGFVLTIAADVAVMAPGTHIGAAAPVSGTGEDIGDTMEEKVTSDTAAYVRTLAEARGRNVTLAEEAVTESRAFTENEALSAEPALIDFVAGNVDELLRELNGRTVTRFDGRTTRLNTTSIVTRRINMSTRQQFLSGLAHPQIASLLLTLGMLGLTIELWNPGGLVPGVMGGLCLLLAFFAFQIVPVSAAGLLLIVFGVGLLFAELLVPSFGILGVGGLISLVVGSVILTEEVPGLSVEYRLLLPPLFASVALFLFLGRLAVASQRRPAVTGAEGLIGAVGHAHDAMRPDIEGYVELHGELWQATSRLAVEAGQVVNVIGRKGLTLLVEPSGVTRQEIVDA
jgi:membrane-bound serine protease (ClpP class)